MPVVRTALDVSGSLCGGAVEFFCLKGTWMVGRISDKWTLLVTILLSKREYWLN